MTKFEKKELKYEINELKKLNVEQNILIFKYLIEAHINALLTFGISNKVTKETIDLFKKYRKIIRREDNIYDYLLKNYKLIDINESIELLDLLDELNSKTVEYFYSIFDDILDACLSGEEIRAKHNKKNFDTLDETDEYEYLTKGLTINYDDIKQYLNYPNEFWNYVKNKTIILDSHQYEAEYFYKVLTKFEDEKLKDIKIIIPNIINNNTANIVLYELKCAYYLYNLLDDCVDENNIYNNISREDVNYRQYVMKK